MPMCERRRVTQRQTTTRHQEGLWKTEPGVMELKSGAQRVHYDDRTAEHSTRTRTIPRERSAPTTRSIRSRLSNTGSGGRDLSARRRRRWYRRRRSGRAASVGVVVTKATTVTGGQGEPRPVGVGFSGVSGGRRRFGAPRR